MGDAVRVLTEQPVPALTRDVLLLLGTATSQEAGAVATQVNSALFCGLVISHFWLGLHHTLGAEQVCQRKTSKDCPGTLSSAQGLLNGLCGGEALALLGFLHVVLLSSYLCG